MGTPYPWTAGGCPILPKSQMQQGGYDAKRLYPDIGRCTLILCYLDKSMIHISLKAAHKRADGAKIRKFIEIRKRTFLKNIGAAVHSVIFAYIIFVPCCFQVRFFFVPKETNMERRWNEHVPNLSLAGFAPNQTRRSRHLKVKYPEKIITRPPSPYFCKRKRELPPKKDNASAKENGSRIRRARKNSSDFLGKNLPKSRKYFLHLHLPT